MESKLGQILGSTCVFLRGIKVLAAIQLDDEPHIQTSKIRDVVSDWYLTAKLEAEQPALAQVMSESCFGIGHRTPQLACNVRVATALHAECSSLLVT